MKTPPHDLSRSILAVLAIGILIAATFWIMRPFLASIVWATMIVVATWPLMLAAQKRLWGRRYLAVALMTILLMLVLVIPLGLAIGTIVGNAEEIVGWARSLKDVRIPANTTIGFDLEHDRRRGFTITDGGVVVIAQAELPETLATPR